MELGNIDMKKGCSCHTLPLDQGPQALNLACVLNGIEPVSIDTDFNYLEIGTGQSVVSDRLAMAYPQGRFFYINVGSAQVAQQQQSASRDEPANLIKLESTLADLAAGQVKLPQFDFITAFGVYGRVANVRRHIVDILASHLTSGGIFHVGYDAMPGWTSSMPLQWLVCQYGRNPEGFGLNLQGGEQILRALAELDAGYPGGISDPTLKACIDSIGGAENVGLLSSAFISDEWEALYHIDVVRELAEAKLDYACSAVPLEAYPKHCFSKDELALLDSITDSGLQQTARDCLRNVSFRNDIYVRGSRRMASKERLEWLSTVGLALLVERDQALATVDLPSGDSTDASATAAVLDCLAKRSRNLGELARLPEFTETGIEGAAEVACALIWAEQAWPRFEPPGPDTLAAW